MKTLVDTYNSGTDERYSISNRKSILFKFHVRFTEEKLTSDFISVVLKTRVFNELDCFGGWEFFLFFMTFEF